MSDPAELDLATIRARVAQHEPVVATARARRGWQAATAVILAPGERHIELALIRRAERAGDRWSGHMALPGGRLDPDDPDLAATAIRETREEVGLALPAPAGRLDDHHARTRPGVVAAFVFLLEAVAPMAPDPREVAAATWVPLPDLFDPAARTRTRAAGLPFPGIAVGDDVVWGLTYGTLERLAAVLDLRFPSG